MFEVLKQYSILYPILNIVAVGVLLCVSLSNFAKVSAYVTIFYGTTALFYPQELNNYLGPLVKPLSIICLVIASIAILLSIKNFVRASLNFSFWVCLMVIIFTTAFPRYSQMSLFSETSDTGSNIRPGLIIYFSELSSKVFDIVSSGSRENTR